MKNNNIENQNSIVRHLTIVVAVLLPMLVFIFVTRSLSAEGINPDKIVAAAELDANKNVNSSRVQPGEKVSYDITVHNTGDADASDVTITDTLPVELNIVSGTLTSSNGNEFGVAGQIITWTGVLSYGDQITLSFDAVLTDTALVGKMITNTAEITGAGSLLAPEAGFEVFIATAELEAEKSVDSSQVQPGETVSYDITVHNTNDSDASDIIITDTLPAELNIVSGTLTSSNGNEFGVAGQIITWTGVLSYGDQITLSFDAVLTDTASAGKMITNTAEITGAGSLLTSDAVFEVFIPPVLSVTKTVNTDKARLGDELEYEIILQNIGNSSAKNVIMTDTLPVGLTYISNTLTVNGTGSYDINSNVITWTGSLTESESVTMQFNALLANTLTDEGIITNTVYAVGATISLSSSVQTQYVTTYTVYLPLIFKPLPAPTLLSVSVPVITDGYASSQSTVSWTAVTNAIAYEVEESQSTDFTNSTIYDAGAATSFDVSHASTWSNNKFYYRVRALQGNSAVNSGWSNELAQSYIYYDSFDDAASGWAMRREDTDDVNNRTYYQGGMFKVKIRGRWDSILSGPLTPVPETWNSYRIETRVKLEDGIDNLHSYGLIWGADWDNKDIPCPYLRSNKYQSCYNHYYRVNIIWRGKDAGLKVNVKRMDYHDYGTDKDIGETLMNYKVVDVSDSSGWNTWVVEVHNNGTMKVSVNGHHVTTIHDSTYVGGGTYFGTFASSDEYLGTAAWHQYYRVSPLN